MNMPQIASPAVEPDVAEIDPKALLAPRKHTVVFFLIWGVVTTISALNASSGSHAGATVPGQNDMLEAYVFLMAMQVLWVRFIGKGMQRCGRSIIEFLGARNIGPVAISKDIVFGGLALFTIYCFYAGLNSLTQRDLSAGNAILPAVPTGSLAVTIWVALSCCAGICEEIVFRGYLQRQLTALTGNLALAIVLQASIFGIAHAYEGTASMFYIVLHGLILGLLAAWRKNIRACMVEHAAWDILEGLGFMTI